MRILLKVINGLATLILVAVIIMAAGLTLSARASKDQIPTILGHKILSVVSGSMEPTIGVGDVIIAKPYVQGEPIREGDIITYRSADQKNSQQPMLITHRVIRTMGVNGRASSFITKGDANQSEDLKPILRDQVFAVYRWRIPYMGYISSFIRTPVGVFLLLILPGLLFIAGEVMKIFKIMKEADAADKKAVEPELLDGHRSPE